MAKWIKQLIGTLAMVGAVAGTSTPPAPQPPVVPVTKKHDDIIGVISIKPTHHTRRKRKRTTKHSKPKPLAHKHASYTPPWITFLCTAYSPYELGQGTVTASGKSVEQGVTIATDPNVIPLGSTVEIQFPDGTTHMYIAEDTGGAIKGYHIDLFAWSQQWCINFGRQYVKVRVLHYGWSA